MKNSDIVHNYCSGRGCQKCILNKYCDETEQKENETTQAYAKRFFAGAVKLLKENGVTRNAKNND